MSLEKVKEDIWKAAQRESEKRKEQAKEQSKDMLRQTEKSLEEFKDQEAKQLQQKKEDMEKREIASARLEARKKVLEFKKTELEAVFKKAKQKLKSLPESKRKKYLSELFEKAKQRIDVAKLSCSGNDSMHFKGVNIARKDMTGGFIAENSDSTFQIDCSYDALLDLIKERNLAEIAGTLFGNAKPKK